MFKRLQYKLKIDSTIQFNQVFYKQIDGSAMGGRPSSVMLADIYMVKTKYKVVKPIHPPFYKRILQATYKVEGTSFSI